MNARSGPVNFHQKLTLTKNWKSQRYQLFWQFLKAIIKLQQSDDFFKRLHSIQGQYHQMSKQLQKWASLWSNILSELMIFGPRSRVWSFVVRSGRFAPKQPAMPEDNDISLVAGVGSLSKPFFEDYQSRYTAWRLLNRRTADRSKFRLSRQYRQYSEV